MSDVEEMPVYVSHKKVRAGEITHYERNDSSLKISVYMKDIGPIDVDPIVLHRYRPMPGDFLVQYEDGYVSISPRKAFLEGYAAESAVKHDGLPVAGYQPQSTEAVAVVNVNKALEERTLRQIDGMSDAARFDQRWVAIARTAIEQGFMAMNRAVFKPSRIKLPEDQA